MSLADQKFERELAWHCAPSLAGIKPADLLCWQAAEDWAGVLGHYAAVLARRGIRVRVLGRSGDRVMLLVFRPRGLERCLSQPRVAELLRRAGYPAGGTTRAMLGHLSGRLARADFPHEIGLFLGYPPEDVEGFCRDGGRGCRCSGTWKVYGDVARAQKQFDSFHRCRAALKRRLDQGQTLEQVFPPLSPAGRDPL